MLSKATQEWVLHGAAKSEAKPSMLKLKGYDWNVTIPKGLPGSVRTVNPQDRLVGASINATNVEIWAINLNASKGQVGTLLYNTAWSAPSSWAEGNQTINWAAASLTDNVAVLNSKEYTQLLCIRPHQRTIPMGTIRARQLS